MTRTTKAGKVQNLLPCNWHGKGRDETPDFAGQGARLRTVNPGESGTANQEARGVLQKETAAQLSEKLK